MVGFSIRYLLWVALLFFLLFFEGVSPLFVFNEWQTQLTIFITRLWVEGLHLPVLIQADTLILANKMHLQILHECNGLTPYLLYLAAILAYPTDLKSKTLWLLIGYVAIVLINTVRMLGITLVVIDSPERFHLVHDWIGRYGVGILTVLIFYLFTNLVSVHKQSSLSK
ncbi:MAG: exosortase/archaeosortase family protein [Thiomicrorhabdus chilensis]|uniref:exosortase/archaeosortase family protein n=1 Tax=Thiomicrorhabdus chilensis TaxID=63656 RepID=UPI00299EFD2F|nr:exosortase/archaeosortase family protein [Thiomicrorhabdus chilensis]MDX1348442.1 exosortase/archaeosortase family protein [Thiomicrorhabdus chilensis]